MRNHHLTDETLSSYVDGELTSDDLSQAEDHLAACDVCTQTIAVMRQAASAIGSLPMIEADADVHRSIRMSVLNRSRSRATRLTRLLAFSGTALLVVVGGSYLALRSPSEGPRSVGLSTGVVALNFDDDAEVRSTVINDARVKKGLTLYRVRDVGASQERLLADSDEAAGPARLYSTSKDQSAEETESGGGSGALAPSAQSASTGQTPGGCLRTVIRSQPYPMMPVLISDATYKSKPAWLFVFAWTTSTKDDAPLDRIQVWLVDRVDCSTLSFAQLNP